MLRIYGAAKSRGLRTLWMVGELGLPYDHKDYLPRAPETRTPEYRALNPNGRVPTIDDDGFVLWESNAIVRYLAAKHGRGSLLPNDLRAQAIADQWMDWQISLFWPTIRTLFMGLVRTPEAERDHQAIENSRTKTAEVLGIVDSHLASRSFLAGDTFTMGDIPMGCSIWRWMSLPIERPRLANVERWFDALTQRPAYKKIVMLPLS